MCNRKERSFKLAVEALNVAGQNVRLLISLRWRGMLEATATGRESRVVIANTLAAWIIQTGVVAGVVALKDQRMMREFPRAATPTCALDDSSFSYHDHERSELGPPTACRERIY